MVLDVPGLSKAPQTKIQQWSPNGGANQQWQLRRNAANIKMGYIILSVNSGLVLDVADFSKAPGTIIQQFPENGGVNQQWILKADSSDGGFAIVSLLSVPRSRLRLSSFMKVNTALRVPIISPL